MSEELIKFSYSCLKSPSWSIVDSENMRKFFTFLPQPEPEPVKKETQFAPIPAEHMELQQTFNAMLDRCRSAANNPVSISNTTATFNVLQTVMLF